MHLVRILLIDRWFHIMEDKKMWIKSIFCGTWSRWVARHWRWSSIKLTCSIAFIIHFYLVNQTPQPNKQYNLRGVFNLSSSICYFFSFTFWISNEDAQQLKNVWNLSFWSAVNICFQYIHTSIYTMYTYVQRSRIAHICLMPMVRGTSVSAASPSYRCDYNTTRWRYTNNIYKLIVYFTYKF